MNTKKIGTIFGYTVAIILYICFTLCVIAATVKFIMWMFR